MTTREDKLKKLKEKEQPSNEMVVMTNGSVFLKAFQDKIDSFKKAFDVDVSVDADDLIAELKRIDSFIPAIQELIKAVDAIEIPAIPEVPSSIVIEGIDTLSQTVETQSKVIQDQTEVLKHAVPSSIDINGLSALEKTINEWAKQFATATSALKTPEMAEFDIKNLDEVTKRLDDVIKAVREQSLDKSQVAADFTPVRRVRLIGNRLIFDDDAWTGSGGGGGPATPYKDNSGNPAFVTLNSGAVPVDIQDASITVVDDTVSSSTDVSRDSSAITVQLLAANSSRKGLLLNNTDANAVYIYYGTAATLTKFTAKIPANSYWEMPQPIYTGRIDAIWAADGSGGLIGSEL